MQMYIARVVFVSAIAIATVTTAFAECKGEKIDSSWNTNHNKPGSACHKQVAKVRKLEFDPNFECDKQLRQRWQREYSIAEQMGCKL